MFVFLISNHTVFLVQFEITLLSIFNHFSQCQYFIDQVADLLEAKLEALLHLILYAQ